MSAFADGPGEGEFFLRLRYSKAIALGSCLQRYPSRDFTAEYESGP
jgi:hypothetical protein